MTIVSTDDDDQSTGPGAANQTDDKPDKTAEEKSLELNLRNVCCIARMLDAAAQGRGAPRHGIHHPFRL